MKLSINYKILLLAFFAVLVTSLSEKNAYILLSFSIICYFFTPYRKWWDSISLSLLFFSLLYVLMLYINNRTDCGPALILSYLISPVAFYRFGCLIIELFQTDIYRQRFLLFTFICYLFPVFLLTLQDIALVGLINETRVLLDVVNKKTALAATIYGMMSSLGIGCTISVFCKKNTIWRRNIWIILVSLSMLVVVHLINRTGIVIFVVCFFVSFTISNGPKWSKIIPLLSIICLISFLLLQGNTLNNDIFNAYSAREEISSSNASDLGGRTERWINSIEKLFINPFGWGTDRYAHNLWLDIARLVGVFPFIAFIIATYIYVKSFLSLLKTKMLSTFRNILISVNVAILLNSFVEPVIEASFSYFCISMMIWGMTKTVTVENK